MIPTSTIKAIVLCHHKGCADVTYRGKSFTVPHKEIWHPKEPEEIAPGSEAILEIDGWWLLNTPLGKEIKNERAEKYRQEGVRFDWVLLKSHQADGILVTVEHTDSSLFIPYEEIRHFDCGGNLLFDDPRNIPVDTCFDVETTNAWREDTPGASEFWNLALGEKMKELSLMIKEEERASQGGGPLN